MGEGRLVIVGTPIGNRGDLSPRARRAIEEADVVYCEDTRSLRRLLPDVERLPPRISCHKDNEAVRVDRLLEDLAAGRTVAYVCEAGMPGIRDPGMRLVRAAKAAGFPVDVVPGPSAVTCALAHAGAEGPFVFLGFAPRKGTARAAFLGDLAGRRETAVVFEAGNRLPKLLRDLAAVVPAPDLRRVVVARELTKLHEEVVEGTLLELTEVFDGEVRGEVTLVVTPAEGPRSAPEPAHTVARAVLDALTDPDLRPRARAKRIAELAGLPADEVYRRLAATGDDPDAS
ncbi:MAG: 16S rRNA (cytidine(1402)-2'-O)-methyltransferase [Deltaproteobacteria bacterium]|nr:MAG: 16S rRNA (cytidine(1402)-2'-O)-methyltransferase [Deltaproteobacteria bacterium]